MSSSPSTPLAAMAHRSINWSIFLSVLLILAGFLGLVAPGISGLGVTLFFGWLLTVSGATHLIFAWKVHTTGRTLWELLVGLVYLFAGIYLILHPVAGLLTLTLLLAAYLLFEGIFELILGFRLRPHAGWGWTLFDGVVTLVLSFMIWRTWPFSTVWAIGTLVGISMLFSGFSRLMLSLSARRVLKQAS
ncbi:HdeD family acid-resistance protein [Edaphobacter bradus]|uniref:HdeD family acid-resistance protein n=1 Tax=Edaphobacter bradus TaxID=2259016 RepID=UPI0021E03349|nr:HdeD family acid-resistance protein [Edaphobacter bradus]